MIELPVTLTSTGGAVSFASPVPLGYTKNKGVYRLLVTAEGEWDGLTIRCFWHLPGGTDPASSLVQDGAVDVPASVTAHPGNGCITFEGSDGVKTVTSADLRYRVGSNSGTEDGTMPEPGTPAWEQLVSETAVAVGAVQKQIGNLDDLTTKAKETLVAAINEAARTGGGAGSITMRTDGGYIQYSTDDGSTWENLIALAELKGEPGQNGADGAPGQNGADGAPGADGYSPTASVEQSTDGAKITITDKSGTTEAQVLNGKDGRDGADGQPGLDGVDGQPGKDGADGITPTIGDNGNWFLGATDTGKPSRGATGDTGAQGPAGTDGKSAYQYAVDGGYTGTEAAFSEKLAQEQLTGTTDTLTPTQVYEAVSAGIPVKVQYTDSTYGLISFTAFAVAESLNVIASSMIAYYNGGYILAELWGYKSNKEWGFNATTLAQKTDIPSALPNPNALTFTGAVTGSYDGSAPLSVEIPSGGGAGGEVWKLLSDETVTEDVTEYKRSFESVYRIAVLFYTPGGTNGSVHIRINNSPTSMVTNASIYKTRSDVSMLYMIRPPKTVMAEHPKSNGALLITSIQQSSSGYQATNCDRNITSLALTNGTVYTGTRIVIYGEGW